MRFQTAITTATDTSYDLKGLEISVALSNGATVQAQITPESAEAIARILACRLIRAEEYERGKNEREYKRDFTLIKKKFGVKTNKHGIMID